MLSPGSRLGPYEIIAVAGAGGMGEVYRARDTRLGREVAIKVLPEHLSGDPARRERFEREARAVSALNHPHICVLFDIGSEGGADYIVMEHLEGETIADRLLRGALPPDQVLRYAAEIADALARAHRHGIVHRDLKPANVMITRAGAKLLDFGLAKLHEGEQPGRGAISGGSPGGSMLPTATRNLTTAGSLLGTFQYMAPEQLEGKEADARTDIFAFGSLVYEMTTGRRAFEGGSQASLIAAIMGREPPPIAALAPMTPPALERIVRRCLAKDADDRWQNAGDLAHALRELAGYGSPVTSGATSGSSAAMPASGVIEAAAAARTAGTARRGVPVALAAGIAVLLAAATGAAVWMSRPVPAPPLKIRASIDLPPSVRLDVQNSPLAFSPDGRTLALAALGASNRLMLYVRPLDDRTARPLAGTEGATNPFWSPDGRYIGFFADRKLKKIPANGGTVVSLCEAPDGRGGAWSPKGIIVFSPSPFGALFKVPEAGGTPTPVTTAQTSSVTHRMPCFLPGGNRVLYFAGTIVGDQANGLRVIDLDTTKDTMVLAVESGGQYVAPGWIAFVRDRILMVQRFDPVTLALSGEAIPIGEGVRFNPARWAGTFALSDQGSLVYQAGALGTEAQVAWFDEAGKKLGTVGEPGPHFGILMSPDGKRALSGRLGPTGSPEIWIVDLQRGISSRLTFGNDIAQSPVWSPDGRLVAYTDGDGRILVKRADGTGQPEEWIGDRDRLRSPMFWTRDTDEILFRVQVAETGLDIQAVSARPGHEIRTVLASPANELRATISPDGRWLAYVSDESGGRDQIFVVPYPGGGGKWQVTSAGVDTYSWSPDGRKIVFQSPDGKLHSVAVNVVNGSLELGEALPYFGGEPAPRWWELSPDGKRVLGVVQAGETSTYLEFESDWTAGLAAP